MSEPVAARGKQAVAQGKVEDIEMSRDKYAKYLKHAAEEGEEDEQPDLRRLHAMRMLAAELDAQWPLPLPGARMQASSLRPSCCLQLQ